MHRIFFSKIPTHRKLVSLIDSGKEKQRFGMRKGGLGFFFLTVYIYPFLTLWFFMICIYFFFNKKYSQFTYLVVKVLASEWLPAYWVKCFGMIIKVVENLDLSVKGVLSFKRLKGDWANSWDNNSILCFGTYHEDK